MRHTGTKLPTAQFAIPPHAPKEVAEAHARFNDVAKRWGDLLGEIQDAEEAVTIAKANDISRAVELYAAGKDVTDSSALEREATLKLAALTSKEPALRQAVDETGNLLAAAIVKHRDEWLDALEEARIDAAARYDAGIAQARAALAEYVPAQGAIWWLEERDYSEMVRALQGQYAGGRLRIKEPGTSPLKGDHDPADVLRLAARATEQELVRQADSGEGPLVRPAVAAS